MPKDEPEVLQAKARRLLAAFEEGERIEREGLPHYCERMMCVCHRAIGQCECDAYDSRRGASVQKSSGNG